MRPSASARWSNARELASVTGDQRLRRDADDLAGAIDARWDGTTWVDDGDASGRSGAIATLDALLPALLGGPHTVDAVVQYVEPTRHGAPFGPSGVSRSSPSYAPSRYWRGATWPQLAYLSFLAATSSGRTEVADSVRTMTVSGASASGWAEYWNPEDGTGLGAVPQSWTSVVAAMVSRA